MMMSGDVSSDWMVRGAGDGSEATVCSMSPIWHETAVHGMHPMKEPRTQSQIDTPHTPQAMLIPAHGTMPISLKIDRRTQADDFGWVGDSLAASPSSAVRVRARALGKTCVRNGAMGADKRLENTDPVVVSIVRSRVA